MRGCVGTQAIVLIDIILELIKTAKIHRLFVLTVSEIRLLGCSFGIKSESKLSNTVTSRGSSSQTVNNGELPRGFLMNT